MHAVVHAKGQHVVKDVKAWAGQRPTRHLCLFRFAFFCGCRRPFFRSICPPPPGPSRAKRERPFAWPLGPPHHDNHTTYHPHVHAPHSPLQPHRQSTGRKAFPGLPSWSVAGVAAPQEATVMNNTHTASAPFPPPPLTHQANPAPAPPPNPPSLQGRVRVPGLARLTPSDHTRHSPRSLASPIITPTHPPTHPLTQTKDDQRRPAAASLQRANGRGQLHDLGRARVAHSGTSSSPSKERKGRA